MKSLLSVLIVLVCIYYSVVPGSAQECLIRPGINKVGIYTDTDRTACSHLDTPDPGQYMVYLCLTWCVANSGVSGWECRIAQINTDGVSLVQVLLSGLAINAGTDNDFIVGLAEPLPQADVIVLASLVYYVSYIYGPRYINLEPVATPSIPDAMAYAEGDNPWVLHEMVTSYEPLPYVFGFNSGPLPGETHLEDVLTWGGVKAMYR